jgi:hypothetical protein
MLLFEVARPSSVRQACAIILSVSVFLCIVLWTVMWAGATLGPAECAGLLPFVSVKTGPGPWYLSCGLARYFFVLSLCHPYRPYHPYHPHPSLCTSFSVFLISMNFVPFVFHFGFRFIPCEFPPLPRPIPFKHIVAKINWINFVINCTAIFYIIFKNNILFPLSSLQSASITSSLNAFTEWSSAFRNLLCKMPIHYCCRYECCSVEFGRLCPTLAYAASDWHILGDWKTGNTAVGHVITYSWKLIPHRCFGGTYRLHHKW